LDELRPLSEALSLCGAGAGGFAVVILKRESSLKDLEDRIDRINGREDAVDRVITLHFKTESSVFTVFRWILLEQKPLSLTKTKKMLRTIIYYFLIFLDDLLI
jgi:hypothetical protein